MAKRCMEKIAQETTFKVPTAYQMTLEELERLMVVGGVKAIGIAFDYGFALALRMVKNEAKRAKKASAGQE